jgi:hypothetical protein
LLLGASQSICFAQWQKRALKGRRMRLALFLAKPEVLLRNLH